jgi:hypothetical protein
MTYLFRAIAYLPSPMLLGTQKLEISISNVLEKGFGEGATRPQREGLE